MSHQAFRCLLFAALASVTLEAHAARRAVRIDGFGDWDEFAIGTAGCPGTTAGGNAANTLIEKVGYTFSGRASTAFLVDDYCQVAQSTALTQTNYFYADEQGLASLFGDNPGGAITGIRYSMLDQPRFDFTATGFQWAFYSFPNGVTIAGLYGLESATLDDTSYIKAGAVFVWKGSQGYGGQYFCFRSNAYMGSWNGELTDTGSACLQAFSDTIFENGFDS
jgi:hypothetical protein